MNLTCIHGMALEVYCPGCPGTERIIGSGARVPGGLAQRNGLSGIITESPDSDFQGLPDALAAGDRAAELVKDAVTVSLIRTGRPETIPHTLNLSLRLGDDDANFMLRFIGGQR